MTSVNNRPEILTKLGVGSGLDTTALIEALVNAETEGVKETLDNKESEYKAQISAFSQIKNNLKVFNDNLQIIQDNNALGMQDHLRTKRLLPLQLMETKLLNQLIPL